MPTPAPTPRAPPSDRRPAPRSRPATAPRPCAGLASRRGGGARTAPSPAPPHQGLDVDPGLHQGGKLRGRGPAAMGWMPARPATQATSTQQSGGRLPIRPALVTLPLKTTAGPAPVRRRHRPRPCSGRRTRGSSPAPAGRRARPGRRAAPRRHEAESGIIAPSARPC